MSNLREIRKRIQSTKKTQQITKAMKIVAATELRKSQAALLKMRPYASYIVDVVSKASVHLEHSTHPYVLKRDKGAELYVVVAADKGLCGSFNVNILNSSKTIIEQSEVHAPQVFSIGQKSVEFFKRRPDYETVGEYANFFSRLSMSQAKEIANKISDYYLQNDVRSVDFIYSEFKNVMTREVKKSRLLPIEPIVTEQREKLVSEYLFEPSAGEVLSALFDKFIQYHIYHILLESYVSELGARMTAMEMATDNADDLIRKFTLQFNKLRQATITNELIEISSGVEAMK